MMRNSIPGSLKDKNGHDCEPVVRLEEEMLGHKQSCRTIEKVRWIVEGGAEITGRPGAVLDGKLVVPTMPLQAFMAQAYCEPVCRGNCWEGCTRLRFAALLGCKIEPSSPKA